MKNSVILAVVLMGLLLVGCTGTAPTPKPEPQSDVINMPLWMVSPPTDPNLHFESGTGFSRDMGLAMDKARNEAQNRMSQYLETRFKGLTQSFKEELNAADGGEFLDQFTQATKAITSSVLQGVKAENSEFRKEGNMFRAYVLMSMPVGAAADALKAKIQTQKDMYTRFRATQTFKALDDEVEAYDKYKATQGAPAGQ